MTQTEIDRAVARVTGENVGTIIRRGFSIADPAQPDYDPEPSEVDVEAMIVDSDGGQDRCRVLPHPAQPKASSA
jgi:hypothetical protein